MEPVAKTVREKPGFLSTELANSLTHGIGLAFSIGGLALLVILAGRYGSAREIVACSVYGATLILLYLASTLYHSFYETRARRTLQVIDHSAIYLLIAGTYTPFALITLRESWGWQIFSVIWGCALLGILYKIFFTGRFPVFSVGLYLVMGWLALLIIKPLLAELSPGVVWWLLAGGLCYTVGLIFYAWKSIRHHHAIWHLFVMGGSTCHFFAVMFYVLPKG